MSLYSVINFLMTCNEIRAASVFHLLKDLLGFCLSLAPYRAFFSFYKQGAISTADVVYDSGIDIIIIFSLCREGSVVL